MITQAQYDELRTRLNTWNDWSEQFRQSNGWIVIPDSEIPPVSISNAERAAVEEYEIHRDQPDRLIGYLGNGGFVTGYTGCQLGTYTITSTWLAPWHTRMYAVRARIAGREYYGRGLGVGMSIKLHAKKV